MKPEKANTLLRGLRPLLPGVVLSALSSMGLLLGLEGLLFDLLGLVWLILLLAGLKVLSPLEQEYRKAAAFVLTAVVFSAVLAAGTAALALLDFTSQDGTEAVVLAVSGVADACIMCLVTVLECFAVIWICRATGRILEQQDSTIAALSGQAGVLYCVFTLAGTAAVLLSHLPALGGGVRQVGGIAMVLGCFILAAFFSKARRSLES